MTRAALLALLLLTGCAADTELIQASYSPNTAYELVGFDWCSPAQLHQCAMIRQGNELLMMQHPSRIGDTDDVWDIKATQAERID